MRRRPPSARVPAAHSLELEIAAVGAQGDGLSHQGSAAIFTPLTLPGERVRARVEGDRGELEAVLAASPDRVSPPCPHFGDCGGCAFQHWAHDAYLAWKREEIARALAREGIEAEFRPGYASGPGERRRVAWHARAGGRDQAKLGYKARRSWRLVEIETCPITDPRLVAALPAMRRLAAPLFEHPKSAPTLHLTLTETGIDCEISGVERKSGGLSADARVRIAEAAGQADLARVTLGGEILYMARSPLVRFGQATVALPAGGFLQASAGAEAAMARIAAEAMAGAARTADLFCGAGAFTFRLAEQSSVLAADMGEGAIAALRAGLGSAPGLKPILAEARDLDRRPVLARELKGIDAVLFDPPRAGALEQAREIALSGASVAVGVSCNPQTFARDAKLLIDGGFRLESIAPIDQFLWSPHIELVGVFRR
jgi:23S rRNA (uracil1939-C5)-methyltransferase